MLLAINISVLFNKENIIIVAEKVCTEILWLMLGTKCRACITEVMKHSVPQKAGNVLRTTEETLVSEGMFCWTW
jgi:hypothetical protein